MTHEELKEKIETLDNLWKTSQFIKAKELANELLADQEVQVDRYSLAKVINILGIVHRNLSEYNKALEYIESALSINKEIENKSGIAVCLGNIGTIYQNLFDYSKALEYYFKALDFNEEVRNKTAIAANLGNIGVVYDEFSDYPKALEYHSKALLINEEIKNKYGIADNFGNIGIVYNQLSDYPKALEFYQKSLDVHEEIGNKIGIAYNLGHIGIVYWNLLDYSKSLEYLQKALLINKDIGRKYGVVSILGNIGNVYGKLLEYSKSLEFLKKSYSLSIEIGAKNYTIEALKNLSEIYDKMGDIKRAYTTYKQYIELKDEFQSEENVKKAQLFDQRRKLEEDEKVRQLKLARFQEQERIFHNILPISIANRMIEGELSIAESFENVSIFFSDIVEFTTLSSLIEPAELVKGLNTIFTAFDRIGTKYGLEKIKTIGDAYMAVCGVPEIYFDHTMRTASFALEVIEVLNTLELRNLFKNLQIRIGLHCGSVIAGIIGEKKFAYDVWGDAVNVASRMESNSEPGRIHISEEFAKSISEFPEFSIIPRGEIYIKGKGTMKTFWLEKGK